MPTLREAAQGVLDAWDDRQDIYDEAAIVHAMVELRQAVALTGNGWQILPGSSPNLTAAEYVEHYYQGNYPGKRAPNATSH